MSLVIIVDERKIVDVLGKGSPLPVEVVKFGHDSHGEFFKALDCTPLLRTGRDNQPFVTDNGNYTYDCRFKQIDQPAVLEDSLKKRAGIVESGLFVGMANLVLVADATRVKRIG